MKKLYFYLIVLYFVWISPVAAAQDFVAAANTQTITFSFNKEKLTQDVLSGTDATSGGLMITSRYLRTQDNLNAHDFLELSIGDQTLFSFSIIGNQFVITRKVKWRECISWNSAGCTAYSHATYGDMAYSTWDDQFVGHEGWLSVEIADNGVFIKVSQEDGQGPFLSDLSYAGLHDSAIEALLAAHSEPTVTLTVQNRSDSHVALMDLKVYTGGVRYIKAVDVQNDPDPLMPEQSTSPQTAYPFDPLARGTTTARSQGTGAVLSEEDPASGTTNIYPNPAAYEFFLETVFPVETETRLVLYDLQGRPMATYTQTIPPGSNIVPFSIDRAKVSPGMLVYELQYKGRVERGKLLIE